MDWNNRIVGYSEVSIEDIVLNPRNPKEHPQYQKQMISGLIGEVGLVNAIIINKRTGHMVDGEGRYWVAKDEQQTKLPALWIDVSEEEEYKILAGLDTTVLFASINKVKMQTVIQGIQARSDGVRNIVKAIAQRNALIIPEIISGITGSNGNYHETDENKKTGVDENNEITETVNQEIQKNVIEFNVHAGDIWELADGIFVCCGDTRRKEDIDLLMSLSLTMGIAGVFTSPPYAMQRRKEYGGIEEDEYVDWWEDVQCNCKSILRPDGNFFLNIKPHTNSEDERSLYVFDLVLAMKRRWGWKFIEEFCWTKMSYPKNVIKRFKNGFEPVYQFALTSDFIFNPVNVMNVTDKLIKRGGEGTGNTSWSRWQGKGALPPEKMKGVESGMAYPSNVIKASMKPGEAYGHEAAFPEQLAEFFVSSFSEVGDTWYDPFAGSGTVGVVCKNLGRKCIMMEIKPEYIAVMIDRFRKEVGSEPNKIYSKDSE